MPQLKRSKHNLSHYKLLTCDMGELIPAGCLEVLPGDTFDHSASALVRVSPLIAPVMHPVEVRLHHFFVANRLIWDLWEDFITGGSDGNDVSTPPSTVLAASTGSLADYIGIPANAGTESLNVMAMYAYNMVYNEFYRDQDLITEANLNDTALKKVAWQKDYFTAARPWEQKGDSVTIPLTGGSAPVVGDGTAMQLSPGSDSAAPINVTANLTDVNLASTGGVQNLFVPDGTDFGAYADLSAIDALDVSDVRFGLAMQRFKEARARYGSRYTEYLRYLGVTPQDSRLDRPEYLGGGKQTISFSEVLQTAEGTDPVGDMKGHGIASLRSNKYRKFFSEHGFVITLLSVRPKSMYVNGIPRKFNRFDKEDYYQKELELIGQQSVLNKEVYANHTTPQGIFGYNDRYSEYKFEPSTVHGLFRSTLDHFHLARQFSSDPALNQSFIECTPRKDIHADVSSDALWIMVNHRCVARRMVRKNAQARVI